MMERDDKTGTVSGLTAAEAKEFHSLFMFGFLGFTVIAIIAHFLAWSWRPWFPGVDGYAAVHSHVQTAQALITNLLA
jgi:light-harvesting complex 1 beta chain